MNTLELYGLIRRLNRIADLDSRKLVTRSGLSIPQWLALDFLSKQSDCICTQLELRKALNLNSSTVTGIVSRLESKGAVVKLPVTGDKRNVRLALTQLGLDKISREQLSDWSELENRLGSMTLEQKTDFQQKLIEIVHFLE
ncbi:MAG: MarR family transcriptional regulator [Flavobacteriales bacterium]|nr:MarR family transcriptional regulator [Flavobacteriales bacterium]